MTSVDTAIAVSGLTHRYGTRTALAGLELSIRRGEIFAILGPNGGGKTTFFRLLSTLIPLQSGSISVLGVDVGREPRHAQPLLGVVFQAPSLDKKLTVSENLRHQGPLYGLSGVPLQTAHDRLLGRLGLTDRAGDLVETLSGGLRRRVELAKGLLHQPPVLILDEPSTGLDPGARSDLWKYLGEIRERDGVTVVMTTHLLEEAEKADRIAILDAGKLVALDTPDALRATVGGETITIETDTPEAIVAEIQARHSLTASVIEGTVRLEVPAAHTWIARIVESLPAGQIRAITLRKPTLEDVFIAKTGHRFWTDTEDRRHG